MAKENEKAQAPESKAYRVNTPINHGEADAKGKLTTRMYKQGESITLTPADAASLLACGAISE
ncbi:hypothetical protein C7S18_12165 [Ahniella affigens]|uniref:Uncharacterized protein n=1 Tax=Ahniella affigens TaxID=2021234 RepID=A0A2P1PSU1_9GAMM|nr:hypothetical protein [Ahniella affigens]AVP97906.1 hypothetical protein C7S18_12165 [Ahniella affigens]